MRLVNTETRKAIAVGFQSLPPDTMLNRKQVRYLIAGQCSDAFLFSLFTKKLAGKLQSTLGEETLSAGDIAEFFSTTNARNLKEE